MKEKIFQKLKTKYSALGLGDEILLAHAEMLSSVGFVTEDNMDSIVDGQKGFLEGLQKANDKRATEAAKTAKENAKKEFEDEQAKKDAERKAAEEEARKKAEDEEAARKAAEEAKKKADEEAAAKAAKEEEERKKLEEMRKNQEIPQYVKDMQEEYLRKLQEERKQAEDDRKAFKELIEQMRASNDEQKNALAKQLTELTEQNKKQSETILSMKEESDKAKAQQEREARQAKINAKAKELGIPQWRIDEGLPITEEMDDDAVTNKLNVIATNIKSLGLKPNGTYQMGGEHKEASREDVKAVAAMMVKH
ncbi:MAG: hypothetical protein IJ729_03640 [Alloprevotella sp.]|nr:hypothetical protein [Alloprevotella sp.]